MEQHVQKQLILIVDDTPENVELLHAALEDDFRTKFAVSGEKALRLASAEPQPDLILLDVMMPEMDGYEVCRRLKANPVTRDIPVMFVTALREVKDEKQGLELGAVDYITKPISQPIVLARIRTHLALKNAAAEQRRTEARLKQTLSELELILQHASLGVLVVVRAHGERLIMRANRAMEQMFGYGHGEMEGRDTREIAPSDEEYREFESVYDAILQAGRPHVCDQVLRCKCGKRILTHMVGVAVDPQDLSKGAIWLVEDISERTAAQLELQARNADLTAALESLKMAQGELLRTEKLAALGSLVAGIAHELNTPIGNALMVASTMHEQTANFSKALVKGIRRSELDAFLNDTLSANDIMLRNLHRAAEQVSSFKQVAVDQTSSQRRRFRLAEIVAEIVITLRPTFKKTPYRVEYDIPEGIEMDSLPGPLGQVITNLINNSVLHGFDDRSSGLIFLKAQMLDAQWLELQVTDDGVGIDPANLAKVFDPFFTTKLGHGGSGLGLSIVYTIVTEVLGGKIDVSSTPGAGTTVKLCLPLVAPLGKSGVSKADGVA